MITVQRLDDTNQGAIEHFKNPMHFLKYTLDISWFSLFYQVLASTLLVGPNHLTSQCVVRWGGT